MNTGYDHYSFDLLLNKLKILYDYYMVDEVNGKIR